MLVSAASPFVIHWSRAEWHHGAVIGHAHALTSPGVGAGVGPRPSQGASAGHADGMTGFPAQDVSTGPGWSQWSQIAVARVRAARVHAARLATARRAAAEQEAHRRAEQEAAAAPVYRNPLRSISGLLPERVDMGVDFGGSGPIYAVGDAVITNATAGSPGWPGGGWITYRLTDGPAAGLMVYVAEDVTPDVEVGQAVTSSTVIGNMFNAGDGIETGWAMPDGNSAESQLPEAGSISGGGPFPTMVGNNFDDLLQALGVPAAPNATEAGNGILPTNYPTNWAAATKP